MVKKAQTSPKKTKSKVPSAPIPSAVNRENERKWQRQNDLRTLRDAEEIKSNPARVRGAKSEATKEMAALKKIGK